jgi:hypothetical protein
MEGNMPKNAIEFRHWDLFIDKAVDVLDSHLSHFFSERYARKYYEITGWDPRKFGFQQGMDPRSTLWLQTFSDFKKQVIAKLLNSNETNQ